MADPHGPPQEVVAAGGKGIETQAIDSPEPGLWPASLRLVVDPQASTIRDFVVVDDIRRSGRSSLVVARPGAGITTATRAAIRDDDEHRNQDGMVRSIFFFFFFACLFSGSSLNVPHLHPPVLHTNHPIDGRPWFRCAWC